MPKTREVVVPGALWDQIRAFHLRDPRREELSFLLCGVNRAEDIVRVLAREWLPVPPEGLAHQSGAYLEARPEFARDVLLRCLREGLSLVEVHSHPFSRADVTFSATDLDSEWEKFPYAADRIPGIAHATLVLGQESVDGHFWSREERWIVPITAVRIVGAPVHLLPTTSSAPLSRSRAAVARQALPAPRPAADRFARQALAFGQGGQARLAAAHVGVVGVSGVGSHVVQQLAHLGVQRLTLVDPDVLEEANLNRVVGATPADMGRPKVEVAAARARAVLPDAQVAALPLRVQDPIALAALKACDLVIAGTDTEWSRLTLNRLAVQHHIPYVDCGTGIVAGEDGAISAMGGQVRVVLPDGPCLECLDGIDRGQAAVEALPAEAQAVRRAHGYGLGDDAPAPSVVFLNGVVASLAVGECLNLLVGFRPVHPYVFHDSLAGRTSVLTVQKRKDCVCCGEGALAGAGDLEPLHQTPAQPAVPAPPPALASPDDWKVHAWN